MARSVGIAAAIGATIGLLLSIVAFWPPWAPVLSGDRYVGTLTLVMLASHPLYLIFGDVATHIPGLSVTGLNFVRCIVVIVNLSSLAAVIGAIAGVLKPVALGSGDGVRP